uniref:DUF3560 domain-containing protein n=2 Tax=Pseudomonas syringae group TaxID=136849 RepID=UPI002B4B9D97|nr:DUF3560 domain-containing protein [Pseudomonas syringae]
MNHHKPNQKPAQTSSKAMLKGKKPKANRGLELQQQALTNAVTGDSVANYQAIFEGFEAKGINMADVEPRVNVFTFNAWKALGRVVKRGESGVPVVTVIERVKKDKETGEEEVIRTPKRTYVFHISQTEPLDTDPKPTIEPASQEVAPVVEAAPRPVDKPEREPVAMEPQARPLNAYERRLEERRGRLEGRAARASQEAATVYGQARKMAQVIPFGQPILVGHHSENRDRRYRARIHDKFGKSFALQDKAKHYEQKAASVGTGGISSDDPDAIHKLRAELEGCEQSQERMKAANKAIRTHKATDAQIAALVVLGFDEKQAGELVKPDFCGRVGFADYSLKNNNANMRRIKGRIAELEKNTTRLAVERVGNGFSYREDQEENRVMFFFDSKPDEATRKLLKTHGFNWSPSRDRKPWIRKLNNAGIWNGQHVFEELNTLKNRDSDKPK